MTRVLPPPRRPSLIVAAPEITRASSADVTIHQRSLRDPGIIPRSIIARAPAFPFFENKPFP